MAKIVVLLLAFALLHSETIARYPPVSATTLEQLAQLGIDMTFVSLTPPKIPLHWEHGSLFFTLFCQKEELLNKWLEIAARRPRKVTLKRSE